MKISVTVKAGQRREKIKQAGSQGLILWVKAPATEGKANTGGNQSGKQSIPSG